MIQRLKKHILNLVSILILVIGVTGCEGFRFGDEEGEVQVDVQLTRCWHLKSFCGEVADVDIYIDFGKTGKFKIYQRTEELNYTVFDGTYTTDEVNSLLSGVYSDGTKWATDYKYTVDAEAKELILESVNDPTEVSVYEPAMAPTTATTSTRSASVNDVKPL